MQENCSQYRAFTLSRAPNCGDKYETVRRESKTRRKSPGVTSGEVHKHIYNTSTASAAIYKTEQLNMLPTHLQPDLYEKTELVFNTMVLQQSKTLLQISK